MASQTWLTSLGNAWNGVIYLFRRERTARIELIVSIITVLIAWWLGITPLEWCVILLCIGGTITAEALNTAIEKMSDFQTDEWNARIRDIKDVAAGGVLIIAFLSLIIGVVILGPKLLLRLGEAFSKY